MQFLKTISNLVHQEVTSDVDLIMMQTASKVNAAVLTDGVDLRKLTVTAINAIDSQVRLCLFRGGGVRYGGIRYLPIL